MTNISNTLAISDARKRVNLVLSRRLPQSKPAVFFHGTSSKFLRSILKNGLDPSLVTDGAWHGDALDEKADQWNPSKRSYGGIYYAKNAAIAIGYGGDISRKQGPQFHPIVVAVLLSGNNTLPDEDNYFFVKDAFNSTSNSGHSWTVADIYVQLMMHYDKTYYGERFTYKKVLDLFGRKIMRFLDITDDKLAKRKDKDRFYGLIEQVLIASCQRFLSQLNEKNGSSGSYSGQHLVIDAFHKRVSKVVSDKYSKRDKEGYMVLTVPKDLKLPSTTVAENHYRTTVDAFIKATRIYKNSNSAFNDDWDKTNATKRTLAPIKFSGRNRIICVLELLNYNNKPTRENFKIRIAYGHPPAEFFESFSGINSKLNIDWFDKKGKLIGTGRDVKIATVAYETEEGFGLLPGVDIDEAQPYADLDEDASDSEIAYQDLLVSERQRRMLAEKNALLQKQKEAQNAARSNPKQTQPRTQFGHGREAERNPKHKSSITNTRRTDDEDDGESVSIPKG